MGRAASRRTHFEKKFALGRRLGHFPPENSSSPTTKGSHWKGSRSLKSGKGQPGSSARRQALPPSSRSRRAAAGCEGSRFGFERAVDLVDRNLDAEPWREVFPGERKGVEFFLWRICRAALSSGSSPTANTAPPMAPAVAKKHSTADSVRAKSKTDVDARKTVFRPVLDNPLNIAWCVFKGQRSSLTSSCCSSGLPSALRFESSCWTRSSHS